MTKKHQPQGPENTIELENKTQTPHKRPAGISLKQLSLKTKMFLVMLGISLIARGQQRSGNVNAINVQNFHILTDDAMNNWGPDRNEDVLYKVAIGTQTAMQADIRGHNRALIVVIDREHTPALTGSGNAVTDVNNTAQYMINPDNNCDPKDYQFLCTGVPLANGNAGGTPGSSPNQGRIWSMMYSGENTDHEDHTGPHEFAAATGSLSSTYIESRRDMEYIFNDNLDGSSGIRYDGLTKGAAGVDGRSLPVYTTDIAYNVGTVANGGDGTYHVTEEGVNLGGIDGNTETAYSYTYDIAPEQLENLNGATNVNTGVNTFYENHPDKIRVQNTYYDPATDTQKPFKNPVALDFTVDANGIAQVINKDDYSLKIPNTLDKYSAADGENFSAKYSTPGEYHVCLYPTDNVTNNNHVAKIPLKKFDGFDINSLNLTSDDYTAVVYEYWSNSIDFNNTSNTVITVNTLKVDKNEIPGFSLYPNPTEGIIHIKNDGSEVISKIEVFTQFGQKIMTPNPNRSTIDLVGLSTGIYLIKVETESGKTNVYKEVKI